MLKFGFVLPRSPRMRFTSAKAGDMRFPLAKAGHMQPGRSQGLPLSRSRKQGICFISALVLLPLPESLPLPPPLAAAAGCPALAKAAFAAFVSPFVSLVPGAAV